MPEFRVLLVDDEEELVSTLGERLLLRGISAVTATSGHAALQLLTEHPFDIVVLDLKMPDLDGLGTLDVIKREHPDMKVILITGHGSGSEPEKPDVVPAEDVLLKPFDIDTLVDRINQKLRG